jgi:hypothetical protein
MIDYLCCFAICSWSFTNWTGLMFYNQIWPNWCFMGPSNNCSICSCCWMLWGSLLVLL